MPLDTSVELRGITKAFGDVIAVNDISLEIRRREFFSLLGPSGCGKTTTLRLIAGFEEPTAGQVLINNQDVLGKRPYERNVNTVFQNYALFPHLTVADNIRFGLARKKTPRNKVDELMKDAVNLVRLKGMENRYPRHLSGGQQQRVALARALVLKPEVLLLDEPLGALDLKLRKQMQTELKGLQEKVGITFIYVTHDQEEALAMSDRIAVMDHGAIEQVGTPEEIYEFPETRFVADFIGISNFFAGHVVGRNETGLHVRTEGGLTVMLPVDEEHVDGHGIHFTIRPERFRVERESAVSQRENRFGGRIDNRIYAGSSIQYIITLSEREKITALLKNERASNTENVFSVGDKVSVSWDRDDAVILKD